MSIRCKARDLKSAMTRLWHKQVSRPMTRFECGSCDTTLEVSHTEWLSVGCPVCDEDIRASDLGALGARK